MTLVPKKVSSADLTAKQMFLEPPPGHVMLVPIVNGEEVDEPFFQTQKMYKKYYSDETKYALKKSQPFNLSEIKSKIRYESLNKTRNAIAKSAGGKCSGCGK